MAIEKARGSDNTNVESLVAGRQSLYGAS